MSLMFINLIYVALLRLTDSFVYRLGENCNIKWHGIDSQGKSRDLFVMWNNESFEVANIEFSSQIALFDTHCHTYMALWESSS